MKHRICIFTLLLMVPTWCCASSVARVAFEDMVRSSQLIFHGRVLDEEARLDSPRVIHTYVTFEVKEVWKGTVRSRTIVLRYLGGTVGETTMNVSDVVLPSIGETGIYFVESGTRGQVHPLYGWDQGRFRIATTNNDPAERVFNAAGYAIEGFAPVPGKALGLSTGTAAGLIVNDKGRTSQPVRVSDLKRKVMEISNRR